MSARKLKPYSKYKDSGVEWLGEIPAHWSLERMKRTVSFCQNGIWGEEPDGESDVICVRVADFDRTRFRVKLGDPTFRAVDPKALSLKGLRVGDLLLEKSGGGEKQPVGVVVLFDVHADAICSNFIARMPVASGRDANLLCYVHAAAYAARLNVRSIKQNTGIQNLDSDAYLSEVAPVPPPDEQRAIAEFLDRETARIDALVAKRERLIELLQEQRTALISHAVTKGLDPKAPMKDPGVEWLGEIPAHWHPARTKFVARVNPSRASLPKVQNDLPVSFHAMEAVGNGELLDGLERPIGDMGSGYTPFMDEDVLIAKITPSFENGKGALAQGLLNGIGFGTTELHVIRPGPGTDPRYTFYVSLSHSFRHPGTGMMQGTAGQQRVPDDFVVNFVFPLPPLPEQRAIAAFLDREIAKIDALVAKVQDGIERLKEYRTALISAAVTGKIDVRRETQ